VENFTPIPSLIGGIIIGIASAIMLLYVGKIAGISGIFGGLLNAKRGDTAWRGMFVAGLLVGGLILLVAYPDSLSIHVDRSMAAVIVAGLLVGIGSRLGSGCTSGHGVCGVGRFAPRSLVSVGVFMSTGAAAAIIVNHLLGGSI
jgi:uncharacterized membrane protein YedE/YeeE